MLKIFATHPVQYQTPIWKELARRGRVPFEVIFFCDHGHRVSHDAGFGASFAWDVDLLEGYPSRFLFTNLSPDRFWSLTLSPSAFWSLQREPPEAIWIQGWQVVGYWQAALLARFCGSALWLRAETHERSGSGKFRLVRATALRALFSSVDKFLHIGSANRDFYLSFGVSPERLHSAPYCVDNDAFRLAAERRAVERHQIRRDWGVPESAFCFLFVGKFIPKKRPFDIARACESLHRTHAGSGIHILWVGAGELEDELREKAALCKESSGVGSSFVGFLNQSEIAKAYVAADCLILPSGPDETWGLVANEAMASGLPAIISEACGSARDLQLPGRAELIYACGDVDALSRSMASVISHPPSAEEVMRKIASFDYRRTVDIVEELYAQRLARGAG